MTDARITDFLKKNKYPAHLVKEGRAGLLRRWKQFVADVEKGYTMTIEDYRNDLDVRAIIRRAGAEDAEITALDARFKRLLTGTKSRVWESDSDDDFWCFGYPKNAGEDLMEDLRREGIAKKR